jgi:hypothetical protein
MLHRGISLWDLEEDGKRKIITIIQLLITLELCMEIYSQATKVLDAIGTQNLNPAHCTFSFFRSKVRSKDHKLQLEAKKKHKR